jgi:hypothetical protein
LSGWSALFETASAPPAKKAESKLLKRVIKIVTSQVGVREKPPTLKETQNPMIKTAGALDHQNRVVRNGIPRLLAANAQANPGLIKPGHIFALAVGSNGRGHSELVSEVLPDGRFKTIEGNPNDSDSRDSMGVFARMRIPVEINRWIVDCGGF